MDSERGFEKEAVVCLKKSLQGFGEATRGNRDHRNGILPGNSADIRTGT